MVKISASYLNPILTPYLILIFRSPLLSCYFSTYNQRERIFGTTSSLLCATSP